MHFSIKVHYYIYMTKLQSKKWIELVPKKVKVSVFFVGKVIIIIDWNLKP